MFLTRTAAVGFMAPLAALLVYRIVTGRVNGRSLSWTFPVLAVAVLWWAMPTETPHYTGLFQVVAAQSGYPTIVAKQAVEYVSGIHTLNAFAPRIEAFLAATLPSSIAHGLVVLAALSSMVLVFRGFLRDHHPNKWLFLLAIAGYQVQLILWPWQFGTRAQLPVLAFFLAWFVTGLSGMPARFDRSIRLVLLISLLINLGVNAATSVAEARAMEREGDLEDLQEMAFWVRDHVKTESRIAASHDLPLFHFVHWSGRRIAFLDFRLDLQQRVRTADYILLWRYGLSDKPVRSQSGQAFHICHESPNGHYQLVKVVASELE
jgi:hypothetical protein